MEKNNLPPSVKLCIKLWFTAAIWLDSETEQMRKGENKCKYLTPLDMKITFIASHTEFTSQQTNNKPVKRWREQKKWISLV